MITVFYSSQFGKPKHMKHLKQTCKLKGVQIIEFKNNGLCSLSEAYNIAIKEAKYDIVVCIHDDIYLEKGWDIKLKNYFDTTEYGILGVAGTTDLPSSGKWWENRRRMVGNVYHQNKGRWYLSNFALRQPKRIMPVVSVDGVFIALHKKRIKSKFDERFKGFHFYDIPFCVSNIIEGVEIGVISDIEIKHESVGMTNEQWNENRLLFCNLYQEYLPLNLTPELHVETPKVNLKQNPKLHIIIPSKDNFYYLDKCLNSILETKYVNYKITIADTGSSEGTLNKINNKYSNNPRISIKKYDYYHFAKINNNVVSNDKDSEILLFCNDDIVMVNDAISLMLSTYLKHKKHLGTIGCRLHYGDNSIQHGGIKIVMRKDGKMGLTHNGIGTYFGASFDKEYDIYGNTGAFLMIKRELFNEIGGFDENTVECMEDVKLNMECIIRNKKNIYQGKAVCYHYESISRSKNEKKQKGEWEDLNNIISPFVIKHMHKLKKYITIF